MADPFQPVVSLATPASDLVLPAFQNYEANFARAGNDTIYGDAPVVNAPSQNIDFLFGDIFDNTLQEYATYIIGIQTGNPLAILDTGPPTNGADRFVLGDGNQPYYRGNQNTLLSTDFLGLNEYAVIYDFNPAQDTIQLNGNSADYRLIDVNGVRVQGIDRPFTGKAIFSLQQGIPDLIGYIIARPEVTLDLNATYFKYVGVKPKSSPYPQKIGQLGTTGIDLGVGAATDPSGNLFLTGVTTGPLQGPAQGFYDAWAAKFDNQGNQLFGKQIGSSDSDQAVAIATDKQGNFYLTGNTTGNLFGTKQTPGGDAWVAKYDNNGNQLWAKQFANPKTLGDATAAFGLDVDPAGNVLVSGLTIKPVQSVNFSFPAQDDAFVTKFDTNGNQQWFTEIGSFAFDESYDLAVDKNGNSYAVGWTQGLIKESDPSRPTLKYDAWIAKVNPTGQTEWIRQLGSTNEGTEFAWGVDTDSQNNVYLTGWTTGQLGTQQTKTSGSYDIWLSKFTPDGTQVFAKQIGSPGDDGTYLGDMEIDSKDNIFITGYTNDKLGVGDKDPSFNAFVAKFDTNGTNKWVQQFGSKGQLDSATGVAVNSTADKLYVTGYTDGLLGNTPGNAGALDAWYAQFDPQSGNLQRFAGSSSNFTSTINPTAVPTTDISSLLVTQDKLPNGDNIIDVTPGNEVINTRQVSANLGGIFSPGTQGSWASVLANGVNTGNAPFLSSSDLQFLQTTR